MPAIRIGSPDSPVLPGTPVPGSPGKYYEAGQFAPSLDELATSTFAEADKAGLISSDLPIFDEHGEVDASMIDSWDPKESLPGVNISSQVNKFSMAVVLSVDSMYPRLLDGVGVGSILSGDDLENQTGSKSVAGDSLLTVSTQAKNRIFSSTLYIYSRFYQFISTPIVAAIPGRTKGISVSMFALLKGLGHILFNKMAHEGELELIGRFMTAGGWSKDPSKGNRGMYMGTKNMSSFFRNPEVTSTSEVSRYSPIEDFADTFAHYLTHRSYLSILSPEKLAVLDDIAEHYGLV